MFLWTNNFTLQTMKDSETLHKHKHKKQLPYWSVILKKKVHLEPCYPTLIAAILLAVQSQGWHSAWCSLMFYMLIRQWRANPGIFGKTKTKLTKASTGESTFFNVSSKVCFVLFSNVSLSLFLSIGNWVEQVKGYYIR